MTTRLHVPLLALALLVGAQAAEAKCFRATVCDDKGENCRSEQICPAYKEQDADIKTRGLKEAPVPDAAPTSLLPPPTAPSTAMPVPAKPKVPAKSPPKASPADN